MSKVRGLHLLEALLRWPPETFIQRKLEALGAQGMRVTVASTIPRRKAAQQLPGIELKRVPHRHEPRALRLLGLVADGIALAVRDPRRLRKLVAAVRGPLPPLGFKTPWTRTLTLLRRYLRLARLRPDVVHFEWETAAAHYLPLLEVWDCPVVVSCRGREIHVYPHVPGNEAWVARLPAVFRGVAAVHCVSEAIQEEAMRYGLDPARAWVIRPAVDTGFFRPADARRPGAELRVVSVGDLFWVKGHEYALHAIRLLIDQGVAAHFELVGDVRADLGDATAERDRILGTIEDLELRGHVTLHGRLTPVEVRARLEGADVLLHASLAEGISNTVLEAMACGLPVVATDCGGMSEAVESDREGYLVDVRDSAGMAAALRRLWQEPDLRSEMGRRARARAESEFELANQIPRIVALYEQVTGRGGNRPVPVAGIAPPARAVGRSSSAIPVGGQALRVLSVGSLSWRQGYEWALQALRAVLDSGVDCVYRIVGRGELAEALFFARHQLGLDRRAAIIEADLAQDALEDALTWADVYLDCSVAAGAQTAAAQAQSVGLPLVATDRSPLSGGAFEGTTGVVVPARDPGALAEALTRLASSPGARATPALGPRQARPDIAGPDRASAARPG